MLACPADVDTPSYIALVAAGQFKEAMSVHMERNPFPSICGRVCHHPCETMCKRAEIDDGVSVAAIKRFMGDTVQSTEIVQPISPSQIKRVAVVGAGPAGLSCAYQLVQAGFPVTVFDALPVAGGMLAVGLPGFRLPKDVVAREIEAIADLSVEIRLGQALGRDFSLSTRCSRTATRPPSWRWGRTSPLRSASRTMPLPAFFSGWSSCATSTSAIRRRSVHASWWSAAVRWRWTPLAALCVSRR